MLYTWHQFKYNNNHWNIIFHGFILQNFWHSHYWTHCIFVNQDHLSREFVDLIISVIKCKIWCRSWLKQCWLWCSDIYIQSNLSLNTNCDISFLTLWMNFEFIVSKLSHEKVLNFASIHVYKIHIISFSSTQHYTIDKSKQKTTYTDYLYESLFKVQAILTST